MTTITPVTESAHFRAVELFPPVGLDVERRPDGVILLRSTTPGMPVPVTFAAGFAERAVSHAGQTLIAERNAGGEWARTTYEQAYDQALRIAGWLLDQDHPDERVMIVTENSVAHALMFFGAAVAGVPLCAVSAQHVLVAPERLAHAVDVVRPTIVFAEQATSIADTLASVLPPGTTVVSTDGAGTVTWEQVLAHDPLPDAEAHIAALDPHAPFRFMFTSGSTGMPKAVVHTNFGWCRLFSGANALLAKVSGWDERTLDWMPWSHVAGFSVLIGSVLNGGEYYVDDGRPTPELFGRTLRNLAEVQPLFFANVPAAFNMLCDALDADEALCARFFEHLQLCLYGGAGLTQPVYDRFQQLAEHTVGERIMFTTGYGCTESTAGCMSITWPTTQVGVGLPCPGLTVKLLPLDDDRFEARFHADFVLSGYLDNPEATARAFDEEGFYRSGDALRWIDPDRPELGLVFAGRLAEEFKLSTGTFVRGGFVHDALLAATSPVVAEAVLCGEDHTEVGALVWLNPAGCSAELGSSYSTDDALDWIVDRVRQMPGAGSAGRVARLAVLTDPPDIAKGERSDKGTINQAMARRNRSADIDALYAAAPHVRVVS
ncbi:AMP-binding protein [Rudaeicoccus suwonensis]|uniref:Feruloyl-CoA synthase n=1 Tax=Rudaeicoccus suwonensis TaxID=657409 RepID=A0A561DWZ3_9MICO|nr:AMP-binding protein [Rudaeicoccus suwonensis]TWE07891.1 feruloyl-CoA synthase [Rudaeicoccus suwonensis]